MPKCGGSMQNIPISHLVALGVEVQIESLDSYSLTSPEDLPIVVLGHRVNTSYHDTPF